MDRQWIAVASAIYLRRQGFGIFLYCCRCWIACYERAGGITYSTILVGRNIASTLNAECLAVTYGSTPLCLSGIQWARSSNGSITRQHGFVSGCQGVRH